MRILLAHNSLYYPSTGGGDKSNRLLMEALAARGHSVEVLARVVDFSDRETERFLNVLEHKGIAPESWADGVVTFLWRGVRVRVVTAHPHLRSLFAARIQAFDPDVILTSTDDPAQLLLEVALRAPRAKVVYLIRATVAAPFGPEAAMPSRVKTEMLRQVDGIVGVSEHVAAYARKCASVDAVYVPISLLDPGDWPLLGSPENEFVTMVNPCAVKGIDLFVALAERLPHVRFAAVPGWGTGAADLEALRLRSNITVLEPVEQIDDILRRTSVVVVPSIWAEARSRMILEAMSRGIPVLASNVGGLAEAKLGVPYLLPVNPVQQYEARVDDRMVPVARIPLQDASPWEAALRRLLERPEHYREISTASRSAALEYAKTLTAAPFESYLATLPRRSREIHPPASLSSEKKRLLLQRLKKRGGEMNQPRP